MNKRRLSFLCLILVLITGIAAGADRDVIIGFKNKPGTSEEALIHSHGGVVKKSFHLIPAIAAKLPEGEIEKMKKDPKVAYIEDDKVFKATDEYTSSWGVQYIGSSMVHNQSITGTGVKIAVLDTGIDYNHEDLKENYKGGYDFVFNDLDPMDDSTGPYINSHGTHVSGIIAAEKNGAGVVGVAPNADIYAIKVLNGGGSGLASWIISGIEWAVDNNMSIATMSLGGPDDISIRNAVDNAYNAGVLLIASAGNTNGGSVTYPAAYDSVIAITATDVTGQKASFSSVGPEIELAAPGVGIYSTIIGNGYDYKNGTSMAAPHVAGVAALIFSTDFNDVNGDGKRDNKDVRKILQDTARDAGDPGKDNIYGYGLVDAGKAVLGIEYTPEPSPDPTPEPSPGPAPEPPEEEPFVINLTLLRTTGPEINDAKNVSLSQGKYSIKINNIDLSKLDMEVYENDVIRKDLSSKYTFNKSKDIELELDVENIFKIVFIPYGGKGSTGHITIKKL
ncbi:MAG: S8 family serine peptidase [Candidatus Methanoperedens sp.]|nr:S8 family peptidase [Candidatus Methanoperedens nitroreducens]MDJ1422442.1 S8 family serine peptidase [Candidatus Methanoperedens sp.]